LLDHGLGVHGDLGQQGSGAVHKAALPQRVGEDLLGGADEPGGAGGPIR
jgi:hypothetical protein